MTPNPMPDATAPVLPGWPALRDFAFDVPGADFGFTDRLARENGWPRAHAVRVLGEYRRFLWLAAHGGAPVTPSDAVDQAWHLHLVYTRSYWEGLCRDTLGKPLHHGPTRGGAAEDARYLDQYAATLAGYRAAFGAAPPRDIWPDPQTRFAPARHVRIDAARAWVIAKPPRAACATLIAAPLLAACASVTNDVSGLLVLAGAAGIALFVWRAATGQRRGRRKRRGGRNTSGCGGGYGCGSSGNSSSGRRSWFGDDSDGDSDGGSGCGSSGCGGGGD